MFDLKKARLKANMTMDELALKMGVSKSAVFKWEHDTSKIRMEHIPNLARATRMSVAELLGLDEVDDRVLLPVINTISAGTSILAQDDVISYEPVLREMLPEGENFYLKVQGDSMSPVIPSGSLLLMRKQDTLENGEIGAIIVNGDSEATLKRFRKQGDKIYLFPENPNYEPIILTEKDDFRVVAKAIGFNFTF